MDTNEKMEEWNKREEDKDTNGKESNDTEYVKEQIGLLENHLREQHEEIPLALIKIGLKAVQQWSRKITEDGAKNV